LTDLQLEELVQAKLQDFYDKRLAKLQSIKLANILTKNPYLFRAKGVKSASEFVESVLQAYLSSSEETIFGNIFFEPLALEASKSKGGHTAGSVGVDIEYESSLTNTSIAVKSATNAQNASAQGKQNSEFITVRNIKQKSGKSFDAILGYCYGRAAGMPSGKIYRRLAGQAFWKELTGDDNFYLKIIQAMKDHPELHRQQYDTERANLANRLVRDFGLNFEAMDGSIDWEKLLRFNSGMDKPANLLRFNPDAPLTEAVTESAQVEIVDEDTESA